MRGGFPQKPVGLLCFLFSCGSAFGGGVPAADVRTPIDGPTTITQPGYYYVSEDFQADAMGAITVESSDVIVDLNGHTISDPTMSVTLVRLGSGASAVAIFNGQLVGGVYAITNRGSSGNREIAIQGITAQPSRYGQSIDLSNATDVTIQDSVLGSVAMGGTNFTVKILDNRIGGTELALRLDGVAQARVEGNRVGGSAKSIVIRSSGNAPAASGSVVVDNIAYAGFSSAIEIYTPHSLVRGNRITGRLGYAGMIVSCGECLIEDNLITGIDTPSGHGGDGLRVGGDALIQHNIIERNAGCGINFSSPNAVYRENQLQGNYHGAVCGAAAKDGGGNVCDPADHCAP